MLKASYAGIIVDEYQDCIQVQHEIVLAMNKHLPVVVLGDPMQGIFSFAGDLVDWNHLEFPRRVIGFIQHETGDVIVSLKLIPKAVVLIVDVFFHDMCPPYVNLILR